MVIRRISLFHAVIVVENGPNANAGQWNPAARSATVGASFQNPARANSNRHLRRQSQPPELLPSFIGAPPVGIAGLTKPGGTRLAMVLTPALKNGAESSRPSPQRFTHFVATLPLPRHYRLRTNPACPVNTVTRF
jgi:hypothetical protein